MKSLETSQNVQETVELLDLACSEPQAPHNYYGYFDSEDEIDLA